MINARYVDSDKTVVAWDTPDGFSASALATAREVLDYLAAGGQIAPYDPPIVDPKERARAELAASDKDLARVAEDLIGTLIRKGLITEQDLPADAVKKLKSRAETRKALK